MTWPLFQLVWPVLLILLYALATCMVRVLSTHRFYAVEIHDRVCESRNLRRQYLEDRF